MSDQITIALDAMGGDSAPQIVVAGANIARRRHPDVKFILYGDADEVSALVARQRGLDEFVEVRHADERVQPDDKPSQIVRSGKETSMWKAIEAVRDGDADGVVSAGNTGALLAMAMLILKRLEGIDRPAIASFFPTLRGETVMLDLGANIQCDARNLVEFSIMGEVFARTILGVQDPTIGLLNVGEEETKGNDALRDAANLLQDLDLPGEFVGFVEGDDIPAGAVDVVVTDGFTGNVALKTAEGTAKLLNAFIKETFRNSFWAKIGYIFAKRSFDKLRSRSDPRRYNGAMFLGLNGVCVKSHGGTDAVGFATAIGVAIDMIKYDGNALLKSNIERLDPDILRPQVASAAAS
ncbi:MAG: phosphate acyltransferase PlsX [Alphaproteobacteria bacterium]|nr:phosphate acyltransferase PlsX [Alphaproteobacteria bacterium]